MGRVTFNMTMSLDGFVAGPNDGPENGLGDGGDRLFRWYSSGDTEIPISDGQMVLKVSAQSARILREAMETYGAGVWGRKTFDIAHAWGGHPPGSPAFIVTHNVPQEWVYEGSPFTFVTDGVESAIRTRTNHRRQPRHGGNPARDRPCGSQRKHYGAGAR